MSDIFDHAFEAYDRMLQGEGDEYGPAGEVSEEEKAEYKRLRELANRKGYKEGWIFYRLKDKFGELRASRLYNHFK